MEVRTSESEVLVKTGQVRITLLHTHSVVKKSWIQVYITHPTGRFCLLAAQDPRGWRGLIMPYESLSSALSRSIHIHQIGHFYC